MKTKILCLFLLMCAALIATTAAGVTTVSRASEPVSMAVEQPPTQQLIIKYTETAEVGGANAPNHPARMAQLSAVAGVQLSYFRVMSYDAHVLRLPNKMSVAEAETIANRLEALEEIEFAFPDYILTTGDRHINQNPVSISMEQMRAIQAAPNDSMYSQQWHYRYTANTNEGLNLEPAWDITTGNTNVVVAVLDTGQLNHADLAGRQIAGYDMLSDPGQGNDGDGRDNDPSDPGDSCEGGGSSWHGTHVAGTIGAATNNSNGVAGVNWGARIQHVRVLGVCGGSYSDIIDGMLWAAGLPVTGLPTNPTPAKVLNMSLGGAGQCTEIPIMQTVINDVVATGAIILVAAGNNNLDASGFIPASCNNIITIASNGHTGSKASYSNFGSVIEVTAPGGDQNNFGNEAGVLSTLNAGTTGPGADNYVFYQGTSMATPHVAGLVSLIVTMRPSYNQTQVLNLLQSTARAFPASSTCNTSICGSGIVDAAAALAALNVPLNEKSYLPVLLRNFSGGTNPTPTPTVPGPSPTPTVPGPTPTPTTPPSSGIVNGNFEGTGGWTEEAASGEPIIVTAPNGITPRSGSKIAWLGGLDNELATISQQITVPMSNNTLTFWYIVSSQDICGYDFGRVLIGGTEIWSQDLCTDQNSAGWEQATISLSAYAGQTVTLEIQGETDGSTSSSFFVDDVSIP